MAGIKVREMAGIDGSIDGADSDRFDSMNDNVVSTEPRNMSNPPAPLIKISTIDERSNNQNNNNERASSMNFTVQNMNSLE